MPSPLPEKLVGPATAFVVTLMLIALAEFAARLLLDPVSRLNFTVVPATCLRPADFDGVPFLLRPSTETTQEFGSDPRGYFDPGASLTYRTNALGFRGPERARKKPAGVLRIVGLGDSFTFGEGVRYADTYLAQLERSLADEPTGQPVEILNLGVSGFNTENEVSLLENFGIGLEPDIVVVGFFLNDTGGGGTTAPFNPVSDVPASWWRRLRFVDVALSRLERQRAVEGLVARYRDSFALDDPGWVGARVALTHARKLSLDHGFRLVIVIFPVMWRLSDDYPFRGIHTAVTAFGESLGLPVLDLIDAFEGHDGPELWVHPNNQHPNEVAHAIAGQALHRFLIQREIL